MHASKTNKYEMGCFTYNIDDKQETKKKHRGCPFHVSVFNNDCLIINRVPNNFPFRLYSIVCNVFGSKVNL